MSEKLSGRCPGCGALLVYNAGDSTVMCNVCDVPHSVKELETGAKVAKSTAAASKVSFGAMLGFDNPESGVVYLENFFDTYNWAEYQDLPEIEIEEIAEVVENNKIKNGANGQSWYLVFKSISVPVAKKIAGLKAQADAMGAKYNAEDGSESLAIFDNYRKVISALSTQKDQILLKLENAVKYAEKFALDGARLAEIKKELQEVSKALATVKEVKTIDDVAEYIAAQDKASEVLAKTFAEKTGCNVGTNREAVKDAKYVFLAVKPAFVKEVLNDIKDCLENDSIIISMAAGISLDFLESNINSQRFIRIMPNMPAQISEGMTALCYKCKISESELAEVISLIEATGKMKSYMEK